MVITATAVKNFCEKQLNFGKTHPENINYCFRECVGVIRFMQNYDVTLANWWDEEMSPKFWDAFREV